MSPLLRDVKEETNYQGRSQTSEQDEASFERRRSKARIAWNFSSQTESTLGQNQDEAIASSCHMLATALIISNTFILYYLRIQFHLLRMPKVGRLQRVVFLVSSSSWSQKVNSNTRQTCYCLHSSLIFWIDFFRIARLNVEFYTVHVPINIGFKLVLF